MISTQKVLGFSIARRHTRRALVIGYWCWLVALCFAFALHRARHGAEVWRVLVVFQFLFAGTAVLGGVRAGGFVKPFRGVRWYALGGGTQTLFGKPNRFVGSPDPTEITLDERETFQRDRVHFAAYTLARWFALLLFAAYGLLGALNVEWFSWIGPFFFLLLTLTLWSLPQTLILWNEPDMEDSNEN
jgi:hypothetical protein